MIAWVCPECGRFGDSDDDSAPTCDACGLLMDKYGAATPKKKPRGLQWISVSDRLPEVGTRAILRVHITTVPDVTIGRRLPDGPNVWWRLEAEAVYAGLESISHWMPLPEPPK